MRSPIRACIAALVLVVASCLASAGGVDGSSGVGGGATNNWAVLVSTSRFWFNYRHMANTLAMYRTVKRLGIPDSQIVLMLADDVACNPRNPFPGTVYANADRKVNLYGGGDTDEIEVDYKGEEVSVESFLRLISGRHPASTPPSKRLLTDENSNVFIYMTGHGGDEFLKFQDNEEISAWDLADAVGGMWSGGRYKQLLFMVDTCQANTLYTRFYSPHLLATGSSGKGENSYSHHADQDIGVAVTDRFTHHVLTFLETVNKTSDVTLENLFSTFSYEIMHSNAGVRGDLFDREVAGVRLTEFFGGVSPVELVDAVEEAGGDSGEGLVELSGKREAHAEGLEVPLPSARRRRLDGQQAERRKRAGKGSSGAGWVAGAVLIGLQLAGLGGWVLSSGSSTAADQVPAVAGDGFEDLASAEGTRTGRPAEPIVGEEVPASKSGG